MKLMPLTLHVPFFVFILATSSVATAEPIPTAREPFDWSILLGEQTDVILDDTGDDNDTSYDTDLWAPDRPEQISGLFCYSQLGEGTHALTYCCYSDDLLDVRIGVSVHDNPYDPNDKFNFGSCLTFSASF